MLAVLALVLMVAQVLETATGGASWQDVWLFGLNSLQTLGLAYLALRERARHNGERNGH